MSAGDSSRGSGAIQKIVPAEQKDNELLSIVKIDARFMKLLRIMDENEMVDYYNLNAKLENGSTRGAPINQISPTGMRQTVSSSDKTAEDETSPEKHPGNQRGLLGLRSRSTFPSDEPQKKNSDKISRKEPLSSATNKENEKHGNRWKTSGEHRTTMMNQEFFIKKKIKDFVLYLIFLVVFNLIAFGILDHADNYYASVLSDILTTTPFKTSLGVEHTFNEIRTVDHIWEFVNGLLLKVLYEYGNQNSKLLRPSMKGKVLMLFENILIGVPWMRQQRVGNDSCTIPATISDVFPTCYGYYSDANEAHDPFGMGLATAWTFTPPNEDSAIYRGRISNYGGGGFIMNITEDSQITAEWIAELINHTWICEGTRAVFIDFTTYTPNTNLFCVVKLVFELPPTGGVIPSSHFYAMKFLKYVNTWDHFVLGCEILFLCFVVYFTMEDLQQVMYMGWSYWADYWNLLDVLVLSVSYVTAIASCVRYYAITNNMHLKVSHIETSTHASFDYFVQVQLMYNTTIALLTFLVWLKLLKFATLNKNVAVILSIFGRVKTELLMLTLIIVYMIFGFSLLGNMLFGDHVEQFATIWNSFFTLIGIFVGGLYFYMDCVSLNPVVAPIYFVLYIYIVLILLLNVYIALMVHGFQKALEDFEDRHNRIFLGDMCQLLTDKTLRLFRRGDLADKFQNDRIAKDNKQDYDDIVEVVKKHGYRGLELTLMLKKHNINPGAPVSFEKMSNVYADIDPKNQLFLEVDEHDRIFDQVEKISRRVNVLDQSLADLVIKVDSLVDRLLYAEDSL